jgi:hypothetical protein
MYRLLFLVFVLLTSKLFAQDTIVNSIDSSFQHNPKKALLLSAVIPGAGQIYNHLAMPKGKKKAYWKVPLIYAGLGSMGYFLIKNQQLQLALKDEYTLRKGGAIPNPTWEEYDDEGILNLYNQHLDRRDLSIVGLTLVYLLQLVDAHVEAHFVDFDVSEKLTLNVRPTVINTTIPGVQLSLTVKQDKRIHEKGTFVNFY